MALTGLLIAVSFAWSSAQAPALPSARLSSAPRIVFPGEVDSNTPLLWQLADGVPRLFAMTSWGGIPTLSSGPAVDRLATDGDVAFASHPGHGVWMESLIRDADDTWYGYYHHERPADVCGRPDRQLPRIGAARSRDRGRTWEDLGIVLDAPPGTEACTSTNRFVVGGIGDVSALLDADGQNLYLYFTQYHAARSGQGVAVARLAWADRDAPAGKVTVWNDGAWLPATESAVDASGAVTQWTYPAGEVLVAPSQPWHDGNSAADAFWGPSLHWNVHLERYVMLLNRARNEQFDNEGLYVSYASRLDDPKGWSAPLRLMTGGGWYAQVVGLEEGTGTDKHAGARARLFITGKSEHVIEFR